MDINDEAKVGQRVMVRVLSADSKLSLSMVNMTSHKEAIASFSSTDQDQWLEGTVTGIPPYGIGIFVSVMPPSGGDAIQGLVPYGEIRNDEFVDDLHGVASVGQSVRVRVIRSEKEADTRLGLSMRERQDLSGFDALSREDWLEGVVNSVSKTRGAKVAVQLSGVAELIFGSVHISQITDDILEDVHDHLQVGQRVSARVLSASNGELFLSMRPLYVQSAFQDFPEGQELSGFVRAIHARGAQVTLQPLGDAGQGAEGWLSSREIRGRENGTADIAIGQQINVSVLSAHGGLLRLTLK